MLPQRIDVERRWSDAVVAGPLVFLSGQVPEQTIGRSVREQTIEILGLIDTLLNKSGSSRLHLVSAQIYMADISKIAEMNAIWDEWVPMGHAPARATVEAKLANPGYAIEIVMIAMLRPENVTPVPPPQQQPPSYTHSPEMR